MRLERCPKNENQHKYRNRLIFYKLNYIKIKGIELIDWFLPL